MASRVELPPVPAITGMRPAAWSTAVLISRQCSSKSTVGDSPVVPTATIAAVPFATWKSMSLRVRRKIECAARQHRRRDGDQASCQHEGRSEK